MCLGIPMQVVESDEFTALCERRGEQRRLNMMLIGRNRSEPGCSPSWTMRARCSCRSARSRSTTPCPDWRPPCVARPIWMPSSRISSSPPHRAAAVAPFLNQEAEAIRQRLEEVFRRVQAERMQDMPLLHRVLTVEAMGFRRSGAAHVGILITPWSMNLLRLPDAEPIPEGRTGTRELPRGPVDFVGAWEEGIGSYETCSLFSPMFRFVDQDAARAVAFETLSLLLQPGPDLKPAEPRRREAARSPPCAATSTRTSTAAAFSAVPFWMTMPIPAEGRVDLRLDWAGGGVLGAEVRSRRPQPQRLLLNQPPAHARTVIPRLYSLCGDAQADPSVTVRHGRGSRTRTPRHARVGALAARGRLVPRGASAGTAAASCRPGSFPGEGLRECRSARLRC
jgi:[NiFe] hydrogenase assembly HybE family chaperone